MNKLSVIVPIYNGEQYLNGIIESVLSQTYSEFELLLINDGSKDNSLEICETYAREDNRIKIINKKNGGICSARNAGLDVAIGQYISFVDQDDAIMPDAFKCLVTCLEDKQSDMAICGKQMLMVSSNNQIKDRKNYIYPNGVIQGDELFKAIFNTNGKRLFLHLWNCLYRREIIEKYGIRFNPKLKYGQEDTLFNIEYGLRCGSVATAEEIVYCYYRRELQSTSLRQNINYINDFNVILQELYRIVDYKLLPENKKYIFETHMFRLMISLFRLYGKNRPDDLRTLYHILYEKFNKVHIKKYGIPTKRQYMLYIMIWFLLEHKYEKLVARFI